MFKTHVSINRCCMSCSHVSEFRTYLWLCSFICGNVWGWAESVFALRQRHSLLKGYQRHNALLVFFLKFFKNSDNFVETGRTSESFFWRKLKLARSKDDGLRGMMGCYSFKVPSANAPAATARRLASTPLVPSFIWSLFKSTRVTARDSSPKRCFHRQDLVTPQVFI
jgi:hypothetical protein